MKKNKLLLFITMVSYLGVSHCMAQQSPVSSGGNLTGASGSVSYSVGQVVYTTNSGTTGSVAQGVQQPFEISVVLASENFSDLINDLNVYPNPSTEMLTLSFAKLSDLELDYQLIDTNGKVLKEQKNISLETKIEVSDLPVSIYFLRITNQNQEIKTFKIIKN